MNGFDKLMETTKKRRDGPGDASSGPLEYHTVECPGCGKLIKKMKKQKETVKHSFECSSCTCKFSLTFPGTDVDVKAWLRGEG